MKAHNVTVLIGCIAAVVVVAATDKLFKPVPAAKAEWVCITDMECQKEEEARKRGETCFRTGNDVACTPLQRAGKWYT
jgi:hypothetical protein